MNKFLALVIGVTLLSACHGSSDKDLLLQQQLDSSQMEQKVSKVVRQLKADCDSTILELAKAKVDSIHKAKQMRKKTNK